MVTLSKAGAGRVSHAREYGCTQAGCPRAMRQGVPDGLPMETGSNKTTGGRGSAAKPAPGGAIRSMTAPEGCQTAEKSASETGATPMT